ncbi:MAG: insulinase family protein [Bacteroidota bacterium]
MKNIKIAFSFIVAMLFVLQGHAQLDRSIRPEPGKAKEIKIGESHKFTLDNGMKVIVVENHKVPRVSFQLTLDVDPVMEGDAVGYTNLAGDLLRAGTKNRTKAEIDEAVDFIGARLVTYSTGMYASALTSHTETILDLMTDVLYHPTFPAEELDKSKKQMISGLAAEKTNPNAMASRLNRKLRYGDHPYGEIQTEEDVENISRDLLVDYYQTYFKPNVAYLVIVGDLKVKEAKKLVENYFAKWEAGEVPTHEYETPQPPAQPKVAMIHKDGAVQSVVNVTYPVQLQPGSPDAIPASLMNSILGGGVFSGRLMQNLREDKGWTYGARSNLSTDELVGYFNAGAELATEVTDSAVHEFLYEMEQIRSEKVSEEHLQLVKNVAAGSFGRSLESPQTVARFALNIERFDLPEDYYSTYLERLEAVTVDDIQRMAQKYIKPDHAYISIVGDKEVLDKRLKAYSGDNQIAFYNLYAQPAKEGKAIPAGMTAEKVLANYVEAIGGEEKVNNLEDVMIKTTTSVNGMPLEMTTYQKAPNKFVMEMTMNGNVVQKQTFDGEKGKMSGMGGVRDMNEEELKQMKIESRLDKELVLQELGYEMTLKGVEDVDGTDAYKIEVVSPSGQKFYDFYAVDSGLKVQTKTTAQTPQGEMTQVQQYSDYQEVDGVKFPFVQQISGMQSMTLEVQEIKVNEGISDDVFAL